MTRDSGQTPVTRYVTSGDASIAYQVTGEGPLDLVMVPGSPPISSWPGNIPASPTSTGGSPPSAG
jgi:hypothetical protein